jgi:hypothetical protein
LTDVYISIHDTTKNTVDAPFPSSSTDDTNKGPQQSQQQRQQQHLQHFRLNEARAVAVSIANLTGQTADLVLRVRECVLREGRDGEEGVCAFYVFISLFLLR